MSNMPENAGVVNKAWPLFLQECTPVEKTKALNDIGYGHKDVNLHTFGPEDQEKFRDAIEWHRAPPTQPGAPEEPQKSKLHLAALEYATAKQWPVFPCQPGTKKPATAHGFKNATLTLDQINQWWSDCPDYNVAFCPDDAGLG